MSRRPKPSRPPRPVDVLVVLNITPTEGVVERLERGTEAAREIAAAKRTIEHALRELGIPKRRRAHITATMPHADLLTEAARIRAAAESSPAAQATLPMPAPASSFARALRQRLAAWWRR